MNIETQNQVLELISVAEAARRLGFCPNTLRAAIERNGVRPDAVTIGGSLKKTSPLFVEPRLRELAKLLG